MTKTTTLSTLLFAILAMFSGLLQAETYKEGVDYEVLAKPGMVDVPGKIEIREFFSFSCPHCFHLESYKDKWATLSAPDVNFVMTPAAMRKDWEPLAHAYYVAESLGKMAQIKPELFNAIHVKREPLFKQAELAGFFTRYGITAEEFNKLYGSFSVKSKVSQGMKLAQLYQLRGVPALVVNGKYLVKTQSGKGFDDLLAVADFLVQKERNAGAK